MSTLQRLTDRGLVKPPRWLPGNVQYETIMGSVAYGVSSDTSDVDVYGWAIPPKEDIFPHLRGEILGFGKQAKRFEQLPGAPRRGPGRPGRARADLRPDDLRHRQVLRPGDGEQPEHHRLAVHARRPASCTARGSATSCGRTAGSSCTRGPGPSSRGTPTRQLHKLAIKQPQGKRAELVAEHGFDTKFGYHVVRLIGEVEQILVEGDIDLQRNNEQLKAIRRGEWTEERLRQWFADKESHLERAYAESTLRATPGRGPDQGPAAATAWRSTTAAWRAASSIPTGRWSPCGTSRPSSTG